MNVTPLQEYSTKIFSNALGYVLVSLAPVVTAALVVKAKEIILSSMKHKEDTTRTLIDRTEAFVLMSAGNIVEKEFPKIAKEIQSGRLSNSKDVHQELQALGTNLKDKTIDYFNSQNIDIVKEIGESQVTDIIESAANKVSPFPGIPSTAAMLYKPVTDAIVSQGTEYVRQHIFTLTDGHLVPAPNTYLTHEPE